MTHATIQNLGAGSRDALRIAMRLGVEMHEICVRHFPDGEQLVTTGPAAPATIIYAPLDRPNEKLVTILFAAEALRRNGAQRLVLVAPYMCYMRQDAAFHQGEAISQLAVGRLLAGIFDRIVTASPHLHRVRTFGNVFPDIEAHNLSAIPAIAETLQSSAVDPATIIFGPDEESRQWVEDLGKRLGLAFSTAKKLRHSDRSVEITIADPDLITGRPILLLDDIVSSGSTMIACANRLISAGAKRIDAITMHALFPQELLKVFSANGICSFRSTHSVPHPTNAITLDDLFVDALRKEVENSTAAETAK